MDSVHGIMRIYASGSIHEERFIFCQKPGYAVAYRLKRAFTGLFAQFVILPLNTSCETGKVNICYFALIREVTICYFALMSYVTMLLLSL